MRPPPISSTRGAGSPKQEDMEEMTSLNDLNSSKTSIKSYDTKSMNDRADSNGVLSIVKNGRFALYLLSYFLVSAGISSVYMHFQAYAVSSGIDRHQSNYLITAIGVAGVLGRCSSGFILYFIKVSSLTMYIMYLMLTGLVTVTLPAYGVTYTGCMAFAVSFGFFGNAYQTFCGPITVEFVGTGNLPMAFGIAMMVGGTSYLLAPPLTGRELE